MLSLSAIVLTSPGREANLSDCLSCLQGQTQAANEIIVIDDGSQKGQDVVQRFGDLPVQYYWRPNDYRLAYSRNTGAAKASGDLLVFLDSDVFLNPHALGFYRAYFAQLRRCAIYGYCANIRSPQDLYDSALIQGRRVYAADQRFPYQAGIGLTQHPFLASSPQAFAWSGNFAIFKQDFEALAGFDQERFVGWGYEDIDLAHRLVNAGYAIHYSLDVWAESGCHDFNDSLESVRSANQALVSPLQKNPLPGYVLHDVSQTRLLSLWQTHYLS